MYADMCAHAWYKYHDVMRSSQDMVARTNIVSRQGEAVTVDTLQPLTFNGAVSKVQDRRKTGKTRRFF